MVFGRGVAAASVAAEHRDFGRGDLGGLTHDFRHLGGHTVAAGRTDNAFGAAGLDDGFSKGVAAGKAAAAAVGAGQGFRDNFNSRVFLHLEFLGDEIEDNSGQNADDAKNENGV